MRALKTVFVSVAFALQAWSLPAVAGTDVGNGGDAVECSAVAGSRFRGLYAADYLLTLGPGDVPLVPDAPVTTVDQSLARIQKELRRAYPELAEVFAEYLADLRNFSDWTRPRIWTPAAHGLVDITDERVVRKLPANCVGGAGPGTARLIQAVIRQARPRVVQYQSDFTLLEEMRAQPLQLSYLLMHEWLWDLTQDPEAIRWANRFLHSSSLERMDAVALKASLANIGVSLRNVGYDRVCDRTDSVRALLEKLLGRPCDQITRQQLIDLDAASPASPRDFYFVMDLSRLGMSGLRYGDFNSLTRLKSLDLSRNRISRLSGEHFGGLAGLDSLNLSDNELTEVPPGLLEELPQLVHLYLFGNRIEKIPAGFLAAATGLRSLSLASNAITELPVDLLAVRRVDELYIDLSGNKGLRFPPGFFSPWPARSNTLRAPKLGIRLNNGSISTQEHERIRKEIEGKDIQLLFH